jgi:hypothetical protein
LCASANALAFRSPPPGPDTSASISGYSS